MGYDKDYMEYDEFGIVRIRCMNCGTPIVERTYTDLPSKNDPKVKVPVMAWRRLSVHCEVAARLSDGSITGLPHCTTCKDLPMDAEKVSKLRLDAARQELVVSGKSQEFIDVMMAPQAEDKVVIKEEEFVKLSSEEQDQLMQEANAVSEKG